MVLIVPCTLVDSITTTTTTTNDHHSTKPRLIQFVVRLVVRCIPLNWMSYSISLTIHSLPSYPPVMAISSETFPNIPNRCSRHHADSRISFSIIIKKRFLVCVCVCLSHIQFVFILIIICIWEIIRLLSLNHLLRLVCSPIARSAVSCNQPNCPPRSIPKHSSFVLLSFSSHRVSLQFLALGPSSCPPPLPSLTCFVWKWSE